MRIVELRERTVRITAPIRNAIIDFASMTASVVAVITDLRCDSRPLVGYGFNSNGRYAQGCLLRERFFPRVLAAAPDSLLAADGLLDPVKVWQTAMTGEKPGGHGERSVAMGALDMAVWDAVAKAKDRPLFALLAEQYGAGAADPRVFVYAAGGYYTDDGIGGLVAEIRRHLTRGYTVVKIKIGGATLDEDRRRIEAVLAVLDGSQQLAVDANARFDLETALCYAEALDDYDLFWFEEPGDPLDFELHAQVTASYAGSLATGENLFSHQDARNLLRYGGMRPTSDWLQFDCALSYGLVEYLRTLDVLREQGWAPQRCIPHGGHQLSLAMAAGLRLGGNETYPELFEPFGGFPDGVEVEDGHVTLPELPGIGFEGKANLARTLGALA